MNTIEAHGQLWRTFLVALAVHLLLTGQAQAEQKYVVQVGVYERFQYCPIEPLVESACKAGGFGPIKGMTVTIRSPKGELKARRRTNSRGIVRTRLPNGQYLASIAISDHQQPFAVSGGRTEVLPFSIGER